jgi:hypothetical protein
VQLFVVKFSFLLNKDPQEFSSPSQSGPPLPPYLRVSPGSAPPIPQNVQLGKVSVSCPPDAGHCHPLTAVRLSVVAGTQEPEYGPEAIQPVGKNAGDPAYTELTKQDLKWQVVDYTNVETQTFYFMSDAGHIGFLQVIYNNIAGLRVTAQFNTKLFYPNNEKPMLWASDPVNNYGFDEERHSFHADGVSVQLSEDGMSYTIKAAVNNTSLVNAKFTRSAPGFQGGKNGTSNYGTDPKQPWGNMHHHFWPRCSVEGSIITKEGEVKIDGRGMLSHALQGMKPHHAGKQLCLAMGGPAN